MKDLPYLPILLLGEGDEVARARMLDLGADMYVSPAIGNNELTARIYALLRRYKKTDRVTPLSGSGDNGHIDFERGRITLTPTEFRLFSYLAHNLGEIVPYHQIVAKVWGREVSLDTLHFYVRRLKQRLGIDSQGRYRLLNYRGQGYCFCEVEPNGGFSTS